MKSQKKLLAIDGGGIRGILAVKILRKIESLLREQSANPNLVLADYFDYIGGTSTGAIIAAALAIGMTTEEIERFYREDARSLFSPSRNLLKHWLYARYDAFALQKRLQEVFGADTTLGSDRLRTLLMVVMLNATTASPWPVSSNPRAKYNDAALGDENNLKLPLWQLVRASTAAPYYFEPEEIVVGKNRFLFYDGGLTSLNNPAFKLFQMATVPAYQLGWETGEEKILLVSIGTGMLPKEIHRLRLRDKQIGTTLLNTLQSVMQSGATEVDLQCRSLGKVIFGEEIDSEVGDLMGQKTMGGNPLFSYLRYNALMTERGLRSLGCTELLKRNSFRLDDINAIQSCATVGEAVADRFVRAEHFEAFPPCRE